MKERKAKRGRIREGRRKGEKEKEKEKESEDIIEILQRVGEQQDNRIFVEDEAVDEIRNRMRILLLFFFY